MAQKVLVTGGAGFVGSQLALNYKKTFPNARVHVLDNLKRRGSELNLPRLKERGIRFIHGDIRNPEDLDQINKADLIMECSAEPSVQAGYGMDPRYLIHTNLTGTVNCLEYARKSGAAMIFLSTSRVYPIHPLRGLPLEVRNDRFAIPKGQRGRGWSTNGIGTDFPIDGNRSLYGATKLCSELLIHEYAAMYGLKTVINRCGVITGPWQMGKVDQGFVPLWVAKHFFRGELGYYGFDGKGFQVRDILHVNDLFDLLALQVKNLEQHTGKVYNVGGGPGQSLSLRELTGLCEDLTGNKIVFNNIPETHPSDIPYYVTDNDKVAGLTGWSPKRPVEKILKDILGWLHKNSDPLRGFFA